ncbi:MAG TPA: oligosaccharide flippase family protein [Nitrospiraceae bacterium]|nr:oligosaccharide flippase family protein [Nitrospiraceae bacterium]
MGSVATSFLAENWKKLTHSMTGDAALLAGSHYASAAVGLLTTIGAARLLGPENYGLVAMAMAYPTLLWSIVGIKSVSVTARYVASFHTTDRVDELMSICKFGYVVDFLLSAMAVILIGLTGWWVAKHVYNLPDATWLMIGYATSFPFLSLIGTSGAILLGLRRFEWLAALWLFDRIVTLVLVLGLLSSGFGVPGAILGTAAGHVAIGLASVSAATYILHRHAAGLWWWRGSVWQVLTWRNELAGLFGWNYLMVTLSGIMSEAPLMLIGRFRGPQEAGLFRLATTVVTAGSYLERSLGNVVYPVLTARYIAGERESLKSTLKRWTLKGGLPAGALILLTIPFLGAIMPFVLGPGYAAVVPGAQMMMIGVTVSTMFFWLTSYYYASGQIGFWTKTYGVYAVLTLALGWFFIVQWGLLGMAALVALGKVSFTLSLGKSALD